MIISLTREGSVPRIEFQAESLKDAYKIGRLSKIIGCSVHIGSEVIRIDFSYNEIIDALDKL